MPIQFRCRECKQVLSVSTKRAGKEVNCPACQAVVLVPSIDEVQAARERASRSPADSPPPAEARAPSEPPPPAPATETERLAPELPGKEPAAVPEQFPQEELTPQQAPAAVAMAEPDLWTQPHGSDDPWSDDFEEEQPFKLQREPLPEAEMDMTPMVDVTFLLLIFFMITASFSLQRSLPTTAPDPEQEGAATQISQEDLEADSVVVSIDSNDIIYLDDVPIAGLGELHDLLNARTSEGKTEMLIESEYGAKHGTVIAVMDAGIGAGMQHIRQTSRSQDD